MCVCMCMYLVYMSLGAHTHTSICVYAYIYRCMFLHMCMLGFKTLGAGNIFSHPQFFHHPFIQTSPAGGGVTSPQGPCGRHVCSLYLSQVFSQLSVSGGTRPTPRSQRPLSFSLALLLSLHLSLSHAPVSNSSTGMQHRDFLPSTHMCVYAPLVLPHNVNTLADIHNSTAL